MLPGSSTRELPSARADLLPRSPERIRMHRRASPSGAPWNRAARPGPGCWMGCAWAQTTKSRFTAAQVRDVIARLVSAGHWQEGEPAIPGNLRRRHDMTRLAYLLADLPIRVLGRLRTDQVMQLPAPPAPAGDPGPASQAQRAIGAVRSRDLATAWHVTRVTAYSGLLLAGAGETEEAS
jgi:hypothetical protein